MVDLIEIQDISELQHLVKTGFSNWQHYGEVTVSIVARVKCNATRDLWQIQSNKYLFYIYLIPYFATLHTGYSC